MTRIAKSKKIASKERNCDNNLERRKKISDGDSGENGSNHEDDDDTCSSSVDDNEHNIATKCRKNTSRNKRITAEECRYLVNTTHYDCEDGGHISNV
jgi:hypothetical protein